MPTCPVCFFVVKDNLPTTVLMFGTLEMKDVLPTCPFCYIAIEDNLPTCPIFWSIAKKDFFTNLSCLVLGSENSELLKNVQLFMNPKFSVFKPSLPLSSTVYTYRLWNTPSWQKSKFCRHRMFKETASSLP